MAIVELPSLAAGPRRRDWGDDWSPGLGRSLSRLGPRDACVIHFNDFAAGRPAQRAAHRARVVLVFHGRGLGSFDQVVVLRPSVDRPRFAPGGDRDGGEAVRLGFIGRLEHAKGGFEIPPLLARLAELEERPAVSIAPRERYAELVARLLAEDSHPAGSPGPCCGAGAERLALDGPQPGRREPRCVSEGGGGSQVARRSAP